MPRKKISLKGLADFMTGSPTKQRSVVREYKYPDEDEPRAKITYYKDARERIEAFHRRKHGSAWLLEQADALDASSKEHSGNLKTKFKNNARTLRDYAQHFSNKHVQVDKNERFGLSYGDVSISVVPDICATVDGKRVFIKLHFSGEPLESDHVKIVTQALFEAVIAAGIEVQSSNILYLDIATGTAHKGARLGARMRKDIEAASKTISAIWDTI